MNDVLHPDGCCCPDGRPGLRYRRGRRSCHREGQERRHHRDADHQCRHMYGEPDQDDPARSAWSEPAAVHRYPFRAAGARLRYGLLFLRHAPGHDRYRRKLRCRGNADRGGHGRLPKLRDLHQPDGAGDPARNRTCGYRYQGPHQGKLLLCVGLLYPVHALRSYAWHYAAVTTE